MSEEDNRKPEALPTAEANRSGMVIPAEQVKAAAEAALPEWKRAQRARGRGRKATTKARIWRGSRGTREAPKTLSRRDKIRLGMINRKGEAK